MCNVNKVDYFVGAFVSTLLRSGFGTPTLFDATEKSKRLEFITGCSDFNLYIKYSSALRTCRKTINGVKKNKMSCDVTFNDNEYKYLSEEFPREGKQNYICLICTNKGLGKTKIAVLKYGDAVRCLQHKTNSGSRRITVTRIGKEHEFYCYGVNLRNNPVKCPRDWTWFLA